MDVAWWRRTFEIAKSHELNHFRFHSWCPPEAAFEAADELGVYLQAEMPLWSHFIGKKPERQPFLYRELESILDTYGNHPSFVMMCMGNEMEGDYDWLEGLVARGRKHDSRRLFSGSTARKQLPSDQYLVTHRGVTDYGGRSPAPNWDYDSRIPDVENMREPADSHPLARDLPSGRLSRLWRDSPLRRRVAGEEP